ncbi:hypothetical protein GCM10011338_01240 [Alteromonas lipolytica]|uniref:PilZ domain-containing protein n=2 Tax=Alteromonas lipolytica TaxID=1856405 RepID=A0A1E8FFH5_9ALTE|nr:hypothetical protein BFC17_13755 [Alteromonas lipolytica]GGF52888.1 hypothetical protein GCM10011338_01240 [Alteromonas lipolytica]
MDESLDKRREIRFGITTEAVVKTTLINQFTAVVSDISKTGLQLCLTDCNEHVLPPDVKVSIAELKLKSQRYKVLDYDSVTGLLRLKALNKENLTRLVRQLHSVAMVQPRVQNLVKQHSMLFRYVWELTCRHFPAPALQVITGRQMVNRLKTLYMPECAAALYPFEMSDHKAPLHGFFADMGKSPPDSSALRRLLQKAERFHLAINCERKSDQKLISLTAYQCFGSSLRNAIKQALQENEVGLYICGIECQINRDINTPMTEQRLALLLKIDLDVHEKLLALQKSYSHVIYLADFSAFLNALMLASVVPSVRKASAANAAL